MKRIVIGFLCLFLTTSLFSLEHENTHQLEEKAIVYIYRIPNYMGSAIRMKIFANDTPIVFLRNRSYYEYIAEPGEYYFSCRMGSEARVKLTLEAGKAYYIKGYLNYGFFAATPVLEVIDPKSAGPVIEGGMLKPLRQEVLSKESPTFRAGIYWGGGGGFEKETLFYDEKSNDITLSTGGGFAFGADLGKQLNKSFDLSLSCFYQESSLSTYLSNASASFKRMGIIATPAFVIPVKGGYFSRFRLGGGIGLYNLGQMDIDASKAGDVIYKIKYNPTIGYHGSFVFESNFSERASIFYGVKYYHVNYEYNRLNSSHLINNIKLSNPDGSGFDFNFGFHFRF